MAIIQNEVLNSLAIIKVAVPGEASSQHRGVVSAIDDKTITISQDGDNGAVVSTRYSLDYVVLVQWLSTPATAPVVAPVEESAEV
jgi:hypothetical protein